MHYRRYAGAFAVLIAVCLFCSRGVKADIGSGSIVEVKEKPHNIEMDGRLLSAYTSMKYSRAAGGGFCRLGRIGYAPDRGYSVEGDAISYSFGFTAADFQVQYSQQFYNIKSYTPRGSTSTRHNASIYKIAYTPESLKSSLMGHFTLGGLVYLDGHNHFSQPFVMASADSARARASFGVNWIAGTAPRSGAAPFGAVQLAVTPQIGLFADYNSTDFQKTVINSYLLPAAGINCSTCSKDALSMGLSLNAKRGFKMSQRGAPVKTVISGSFGIYDVQELKAPFGNFLINMDL